MINMLSHRSKICCNDQHAIIPFQKGGVQSSRDFTVPKRHTAINLGSFSFTKADYDYHVFMSTRMTEDQEYYQFAITQIQNGRL